MRAMTLRLFMATLKQGMIFTRTGVRFAGKCSNVMVLIATALYPGAALAAGDRALGEYLATACVACHQMGGPGVGGIPEIVGWPEHQFFAILQSYKTKARESQIMQSVTANLSDAEMQALAAYFGSMKSAASGAVGK